MQPITLTLALCALSLVCALPAAFAAEPLEEMAPANPLAVQLSPSGGVFTVEEDVAVSRENGAAELFFVLPADAENLHLEAPGHTIASWSATPQVLKRTGAVSRLAAALRAEREDIEQRMATIKDQLALWQERPEKAEYSFQDMEAVERKLMESLPALRRELADLERRLKLVKNELGDIDESAPLGLRVRVALTEPPQTGTVRLAYTYSLPHCGWKPVYDFSAETEKGDGKSIGVRLMAEVWQQTGMDWKDTRISLVTRGMGPREPAAVPRWELEARPKPQPVARSAGRMNARESAPMAMPDAEAMEDMAMAAPPPPKNAPVALSADGIYASWELSARGLNEGYSRLLITETAWPAPLTWLARPGKRGNQVWLMAKYELPAGEVWPDGQAEFSVDGQNVGKGQFKPVKGEAKLFFGADPRVTLAVTDDDKKRGGSGFFEKKRHWSWAWTYTLTNRHSRPVTVRIERPDPMIVDDKITVKHEDEPAAQIDAKEHLLIWEVPVAANGSAAVKHGLTISAPEDMLFNPTLP